MRLGGSGGERKLDVYSSRGSGACRAAARIERKLRRSQPKRPWGLPGGGVEGKFRHSQPKRPWGLPGGRQSQSFLNHMEFQKIKINGFHKIILRKPSLPVALEFFNGGVQPDGLA